MRYIVAIFAVLTTLAATPTWAHDPAPAPAVPQQIGPINQGVTLAPAQIVNPANETVSQTVRGGNTLALGMAGQVAADTCAVHWAGGFFYSILPGCEARADARAIISTVGPLNQVAAFQIAMERLCLGDPRTRQALMHAGYGCAPLPTYPLSRTDPGAP